LRRASRHAARLVGRRRASAGARLRRAAGGLALARARADAAPPRGVAARRARSPMDGGRRLQRVLVAGGGVAGGAGAPRASERGATTTWVRGRAGASALGPGAADLTPWVDAESDERLSPELERFVAALGAWTCGAKSGLVVSAVGVVRPARARDPLVLDLT